MNRNMLPGIFFLLLCLPLHAQEIELGFRLEAQGLHRNYTYINSDFGISPFPTCIQLNAGISPFNNFWIELRGGKEFVYSEFTGTEYGVFGRYFLNNSVYLTAGYAVHSNEESGGHTSGSYSKVIEMPALGIGIKPWNHVGFSLLFQKLHNIPISWNVTYIIVDSKSVETYSITKVDWLIKFGLTFDWKL
ncbi:MAG: hypothetical protein ACM3Q2_05250 [Syntrophothermus sp.]